MWVISLERTFSNSELLLPSQKFHEQNWFFFVDIGIKNMILVFFLKKGLKHLYPSWFVISFSTVFLHHLRIMVCAQGHFWGLNISLPPPTIFLQPENHCSLLVEEAKCFVMFCAIRPLDFRSHLKLNIYFWKWPGACKNVLFWGGGWYYFSIPLLKRQWKRRLFSQIFISVLTFWKARIFITTQQTSCISWLLIIISMIRLVIPWCIPDFVPSFDFALRYFYFVAITLYAPYPQWAYHSPKRWVPKNPFSSRIS